MRWTEMNTWAEKGCKPAPRRSCSWVFGVHVDFMSWSSEGFFLSQPLDLRENVSALFPSINGVSRKQIAVLEVLSTMWHAIRSRSPRWSSGYPLECY